MRKGSSYRWGSQVSQPIHASEKPTDRLALTREMTIARSFLAVSAEACADAQETSFGIYQATSNQSRCRFFSARDCRN
ncbi:hypothetical protein LTR93_011701 [Exophiala xenobiotica]|nr:hypothetical protein LTR93_011701 [Exophiala xenobiotica]